MVDLPQIAITGVGLTSPGGDDLVTYRAGLLAGRSWIREYEIRYVGNPRPPRTGPGEDQIHGRLPAVQIVQQRGVEIGCGCLGDLLSHHPVGGPVSAP